MGKKRSLALTISLLSLLSWGCPVYGQSLSQIYVSPIGNILGTISYFDPGFDSYAYVNGEGLLVWVEMEMPQALIEIYSDGYLRLISSDTSAYQYFGDGRIRQIGGLNFEYYDGRISRIGQIDFEYDKGQMIRMGGFRFQYDEGRLSKLGSIDLAYQNGRIRQIDNLLFEYDGNGRIRRIGHVLFDYHLGAIKNMTGNLAGTQITITSVVEFREKFPGRQMG